MITLPTRPEPLQIDLARAAIVVVDMQNAFASAGGLLDLAGVDISGAAAVTHAKECPWVARAWLPESSNLALALSRIWSANLS